MIKSEKGISLVETSLLMSFMALALVISTQQVSENAENIFQTASCGIAQDCTQQMLASMSNPGGVTHNQGYQNSGFANQMGGGTETIEVDPDFNDINSLPPRTTR